MAAKLTLPPGVVVIRGKHFYLRRRERVEGKRVASMKPLPHPLDDGFRAAYARAWRELYGTDPASAPSKTFRQLAVEHRLSDKYQALSEKGRWWRDRALAYLVERWSDDLVETPTPVVYQALYDHMPFPTPTRNRLWDDVVAIVSWSMARGYCETNAATAIERTPNTGAYEPWPAAPLRKLLIEGTEHIADVALMAFYTGQDRGDLLGRLTDSRIEDDVWTLHRAKTRKKTRDRIRVVLHPVAMAVVEKYRAKKLKAGIIDPERPLLVNSRGEPWGSGFGASWTKELRRLGLNRHEPRLTFKGLRPTNATVIADEAAKGSEDAAAILARVQALLGHHSTRMSAHYARRAQIEVSNRGSVALLPSIEREG